MFIANFYDFFENSMPQKMMNFLEKFNTYNDHDNDVIKKGIIAMRVNWSCDIEGDSLITQL